MSGENMRRWITSFTNFPANARLITSITKFQPKVRLERLLARLKNKPQIRPTMTLTVEDPPAVVKEAIANSAVVLGVIRFLLTKREQDPSTTMMACFMRGCEFLYRMSQHALDELIKNPGELASGLGFRIPDCAVAYVCNEQGAYRVAEQWTMGKDFLSGDEVMKLMAEYDAAVEEVWSLDGRLCEMKRAVASLAQNAKTFVPHELEKRLAELRPPGHHECGIWLSNSRTVAAVRLRSGRFAQLFSGDSPNRPGI